MPGFVKILFIIVTRGDGLKEGIVREFGIDKYTWLYLKWITNKDLLCSTRNSVWCYVAAWLGRGVEEEWIHVYIQLSHYAVYLKLSQYY